PARMPGWVATDSTQARIVIGMLVPKPNVCSAQPSPKVASHTSTRWSKMPITTIRLKASPIDFQSTLRNGRENICSSALNTGPSMGDRLSEHNHRGNRMFQQMAAEHGHVACEQ